jgi:hypothetical protein
MKRLILCALAVLLTSGAILGTRPAYACVLHPACVTRGCDTACAGAGGTCDPCFGLCHCF